MAPATDEQLMARFQRELADEAMDELVSRHLGPSTAVARGILSDATTAEDAVQEAFLRVVRYRHKYASGRSFGTWFYTILRNVCRDMLRARARRARLVEEAADVLEQREEAPKADPPVVIEMLAHLPASLRAALELRVVQGMSFPEVAAALGITEEAAKKRAQRGLHRLREWVRRNRPVPAAGGGKIHVPDEGDGTYIPGKRPSPDDA